MDSNLKATLNKVLQTLETLTMRKSVLVIVFVFFLAACFNQMELYKYLPDWTQGTNFVTFFCAIITVWFLYIQIKRQQVTENLNHINDILDSIPAIIETIRYNEKTGTEALIQYGIDYNQKTTEHPRVVVDKIQYVISQIEMAIVDLSEYSNYKQAKRIATKACLLFYSHLYFTLTFERRNAQKGFYHSLEDQYTSFKEQFKDLQTVTYHTLVKKKLISPHKQSEEKFLITGKETKDIYKAYRKLTK